MAVAKVPDIPRPTLGVRKNQESGVTIDPDKMSEGVLGILEAHKRAIDTDSAMKVLDKTTGQDQKGGSEVAAMAVAMADVLKGSAQTNQASTSMLLEGIAGVMNLSKANGNGNGSSEIWEKLAMMLLMNSLKEKEPSKDTNKDDVLLKLMEVQNNNHKQTLEMIERHHEEREKDLRERIGASPLDQQVHGQLIPWLFGEAVKNIKNPPTMTDQVKQLAEMKHMLTELGAIGGNSGKYTPEDIQAMGMQMQLADISNKHVEAMADKKLRGQPPGWLEPVTDALKGLISKGIIPNDWATQADNDAGAAVMGE